MDNYLLLTLLLIGHVLGDFYLQPVSWVNDKQQRKLRAPALYLHALVHTALSAAVLMTTSAVSLLVLAGLLCTVFVSHALIDAVKAYTKPRVGPFLFDQLAHLLVLIIVWLIATDQIDAVTMQTWRAIADYRYGVIVAAYLLVLAPASVVIRLLLAPWSEPAETAQHDPTMAFAGQRIGYLERLLVLTFLLLDQFSAVGFLLAAKSIFRFGDLSKQRDRAMTEYVLLGTLTSFAITLFIGLVASALLTGLPSGKGG